MDDVKKTKRDALILEYQGFVRQVVGSLIKKMSLPSSMFDEYIAAGYLGLVEAAERFDFNQGKAFKNYAYLRIRGAIIDSIRRNADIPGYIYNRYVKAMKAARELREELYEQESRKTFKGNPDEGLASILEYLSLSALSFRISQRDMHFDLSSLEDKGASPAKILERKEEMIKLGELIDALPEKEREVITYYYLEEKSFADIAREDGEMSRSWVTRLHTRGLRLLRDKYYEVYGRPAN